MTTITHPQHQEIGGSNFLAASASVASTRDRSHTTHRWSGAGNSPSNRAAVETNTQPATKHKDLPSGSVKQFAGFRPFSRTGRSNRDALNDHHGGSTPAASVVSRWSRADHIKPLFQSETVAFCNESIARRVYRQDDPWEAAKRGDLTALKGFQIRGEVDWEAKDDFGNIPLFYGCSSGAAENVMVVPFLLWATDLGGDESSMITKLRKKACSKQAKAILKEYAQGGLGAIGMGVRDMGEIQDSPNRQPQLARGSPSHPFQASSPREDIRDDNPSYLSQDTIRRNEENNSGRSTHPWQTSRQRNSSDYMTQPPEVSSRREDSKNNNPSDLSHAVRRSNEETKSDHSSHPSRGSRRREKINNDYSNKPLQASSRREENRNDDSSHPSQVARRSREENKSDHLSHPSHSSRRGEKRNTTGYSSSPSPVSGRREDNKNDHPGHLSQTVRRSEESKFDHSSRPWETNRRRKTNYIDDPNHQRQASNRREHTKTNNPRHQSQVVGRSEEHKSDYSSHPSQATRSRNTRKADDSYHQRQASNSREKTRFNNQSHRSEAVRRNEENRSEHSSHPSQASRHRQENNTDYSLQESNYSEDNTIDTRHRRSPAFRGNQSEHWSHPPQASRRRAESHAEYSTSRPSHASSGREDAKPYNPSYKSKASRRQDGWRTSRPHVYDKSEHWSNTSQASRSSESYKTDYSSHPTKVSSRRRDKETDYPTRPSPTVNRYGDKRPKRWSRPSPGFPSQESRLRETNKTRNPGRLPEYLRRSEANKFDKRKHAKGRTTVPSLNSVPSMLEEVSKERSIPHDKEESYSRSFRAEQSDFNIQEIDNVSSVTTDQGSLNSVATEEEISAERLRRIIEYQDPYGGKSARSPGLVVHRSSNSTPRRQDAQKIEQKTWREQIDARDAQDDMNSAERDESDKSLESNCAEEQKSTGHISERSGGTGIDSWSFPSISLKSLKRRNFLSAAKEIKMILGSEMLKQETDKSHIDRRRHKGVGTRQRPYIDYDEIEKAWTIGNFVKHDTIDQDKMVHVQDSSQRVHVVDCAGINIHVHGRKMKALLVENCSYVNVIFDSVITTCDVTDCANVGLQVTGICPTLSFNNTDGVTVWLTRKGMEASNFVTSKSSNILISVPAQDDFHPWDRKEMQLAAQYVHKFHTGRGIVSHVPGRT